MLGFFQLLQFLEVWKHGKHETELNFKVIFLLKNKRQKRILEPSFSLDPIQNSRK